MFGCRMCSYCLLVCGLALSFVRVCEILAVAHSFDLGVLFHVALLRIGFLQRVLFSPFTLALLWLIAVIRAYPLAVGAGTSPSCFGSRNLLATFCSLPLLTCGCLPATLRRSLWSLRLHFRFERPLLNIIRPHARSACLAPAHNLYSCFFA